MNINSATDYGYNQPFPPVRSFRVGDTFRLRCALGVYESRVMRPHRDIGYFETKVERWCEPVPAFREGFVGSIEVLSREAILSAIYSD